MLSNGTTDSVTIVMPVYNEAEIIETVVRAIHAEILAKLPNSKLIAVNDGSKDESSAILHRIADELGQIQVVDQVNQGHGPAVMRGVHESTTQLVFLMDSDNQYDVKDFWKLWERRGEADLLIGTRQKRQDPMSRILLSRFIALVQRLIFGTSIRDANSPFKLIHRRVLDVMVPLIEPGTLAPSIFLALGAEYHGFTCVEMPVTHLPRETGTCSVRGKLLKFCWRAFKQLLKFRKGLIQSRANAATARAPQS